MSVQLTKWDVQDGLQTPEDCAAFVEAAIAEAGDDPAFIAAALGEVARSKGMAQVSRDTGISREGLYKALSKDGNPSFATILKVLQSLGLVLHVEAANDQAMSRLAAS
jgi:probable addiction module antidote protein